MLLQTIKIMKKLREINKSLDSVLKINNYVDSYFEKCILTNKPLTLITPWSLSRSFKKRYIDQGNTFLPTKAEIKLFKKEIPVIISIFKKNNLNFNWWLIFSRSYIKNAVINSIQEKKYIEIIANLIKENKLDIMVINWEDDVIMTKHQPNLDLLNEKKFSKIINQKDFEYELKRRFKRSKRILSLDINNQQLIKETKYKIACEANEGLFLMENIKNPLCKPGEFLFLILGRAERYNFFSTLTPLFKKRVLCILKPYPWRL